MEERIIQSGSAGIYYRIYKNLNKPYIVLLHGNGESGKNFSKLIPLLEDKYSLVVIDSRGHGKSEFGRAQLSLGAMVIDLENVIEDIGAERVNILGFGDGANVAMQYAIKCPDVVDKLILCGGNYNASGYSLLNRFILGVGYYFSILGSAFDYGNRLNKEYIALIYKEPRLKKHSLRGIKAETLVVACSGDIIKNSHSKEMAQTIPNCKLKMIKSDRFWLYKKPEEAAQLIKKFIQ